MTSPKHDDPTHLRLPGRRRGTHRSSLTATDGHAYWLTPTPKQPYATSVPDSTQACPARSSYRWPRPTPTAKAFSSTAPSARSASSSASQPPSLYCRQPTPKRLACGPGGNVVSRLSALPARRFISAYHHAGTGSRTHNRLGGRSATLRRRLPRSLRMALILATTGATRTMNGRPTLSRSRSWPRRPGGRPPRRPQWRGLTRPAWNRAPPRSANGHGLWLRQPDLPAAAGARSTAMSGM
jgi:hypothetical protein